MFVYHYQKVYILIAANRLKFQLNACKNAAIEEIAKPLGTPRTSAALLLIPDFLYYQGFLFQKRYLSAFCLLTAS